MTGNVNERHQDTRRSAGRVFLPILLLLAVGVFGLSLYLWFDHKEIATEPPVAAPEPGAVERGPLVRFPVAEDGTKSASLPLPDPLPALDDSDRALLELASRVLGGAGPGELLAPRHLIQRVVVTVDNLPKHSVPPQYLPLTEPKGEFRAEQHGERWVIDPRNYDRYAVYVTLLERVDDRTLVAVYRHFYPLFQQAYRQLGYSSGYFNDRLIAAIDDMLATPDLAGPVELQRPAVHYVYADPELESLSAGQRLLLRMGEENAGRIKRKLQRIRDELASS